MPLRLVGHNDTLESTMTTAMGETAIVISEICTQFLDGGGDLTL